MSEAVRQAFAAVGDLRLHEPPRPVLASYTPRRSVLANLLRRSVLFVTASAFCLIYGAAFCLFAPFLIVPLLVPIVLLAAFVIWSLPDTRHAPVNWLAPWFLVATAAQILWPNYLAIALPGIPWITVARLIDVPLAITLVVCISASHTFREQMSEILRSSRIITGLLIAYVAFLSLGVVDSAKPFFSLDHFLTAQVSWTAMFFISAYVFSKPGAATHWLTVIWLAAVGVSVLAVFEARASHVLWAGHIPSFLQINDPHVAEMIQGGLRNGRYRAQGTFDGSIQLSEFMALALIFIIHYTMKTKSPWIKLMGAISVPVILFSQIMAGSRSGLIGSFLAPLFYVLYFSVQTYRTRSSRLFGMTMLAFYPVGAVSALAASFIVPALRNRMWRSGGTVGSDQARIDQWHLAVPKILSHPWGYGFARSGEVLGFYTPGGELTVDVYYISLLLDLGVLGAAVFVGMFIQGAIQGFRDGVRIGDQDIEVSLLVPAAIALVNFLIIKSVFAQADNHLLFFSVLGMIAALTYRARPYLGEGVKVAPSPQRVRRPAIKAAS